MRASEQWSSRQLFHGRRTRASKTCPAHLTRSRLGTQGVSLSRSRILLIPRRSDFDEIIQIKVGTGNTETFEVYKGVLKFYSGYFRAAIANIEAGRFAEAEDGVITLAEEEPRLFAVFKGWLFGRKLHDSLGAMPVVPTTLCELWCFGDRRQIPLLQNEAITALHRWIVETNMCPTAQLEYIYTNTCEDSSLRRFVIFSSAARVSSAVNMKKLEDRRCSRESLLDLVACLYSRPKYLSKEEYSEMELCEWHIHNEEGIKCAKNTNPPKPKEHSS